MGVNGSTGPKRSAAHRDLDEERIAAWTAEGRSLRWMAQRLGVNQAQVHRDRMKLRRAAVARAAIQMDAEVDRHLRALDLAMEMSIDGWQASRLPLETRTREEKTGPDGRVVTERVTSHERDGDPAFIVAYVKAQTERRVLLGLAPPTRTELSGPSGGPVAVRADLPPDELLARYQDTFAALVAARATSGTNGHGRHD
jgi:hypothetical protein